MSNDLLQRTEAWHAVRAGRITASRMADVMAFSEGEGVYKSGPKKGQPKVARPLKARTDYAFELAAERITGKPRKQIRAAALQWGIDVEPAALAAYQARRGVIVTPTGFVLHPDYDIIGASPDFLVGTDGGGEIKCPESTEVHLQTWRDGVPEEHLPQIQAGMMCTGRSWWDFVSFHPDFPGPFRLYVQRIARDDVYIERLLQACLSLNAEVDSIIDQVMGQREMRDAA